MTQVRWARVTQDWGKTEFLWRKDGQQIAITEMGGMPSTLRWGKGTGGAIVSLPSADNIWLPSAVLECLSAYWRDRQRSEAGA